MTLEELEYIRSGKHWHEKGYAGCRVCNSTPTCPMLVDEIWRQISPGGSPACRVDGVKVPRVPDLLCLECAEARLGREITVKDLYQSASNYALSVMLNRTFKRMEYCSSAYSLSPEAYEEWLQRVYDQPDD